MEQTNPSAIDKALDVLFYLRSQQEACGVSDVGRALSLPKSSAHRLVSALARRGLLERDAQGRYQLGPALLLLAQSVRAQHPVVAAGRQALEKLAGQLGETCFFVAERGGKLVVLDKVEGTGVLRVSPAIGAQVPATATASGKLYRAFASDLRLTADETRYTGATLDGAAFKRAVEDAKRAGYATNRDEWVQGLSVIAVPVFDGDSIAAVLSVAAPSATVSDVTEQQMVAQAKAAAAAVEASLGARCLPALATTGAEVPAAPGQEGGAA